jgi:hypothetical protein
MTRSHSTGEAVHTMLQGKGLWRQRLKSESESAAPIISLSFRHLGQAGAWIRSYTICSITAVFIHCTPYHLISVESLDGTGAVSVRRYRVSVNIRHGAQPYMLSPIPLFVIFHTNCCHSLVSLFFFPYQPIATHSFICLLYHMISYRLGIKDQL